MKKIYSKKSIYKLVLCLSACVLQACSSGGSGGGSGSGGGLNTGNSVWTGYKQTLGDTTTGYNQATDLNGNVFVVGSTTSDLDGVTAPGTNSNSGFITKYNSVGLKQWTKLIGGGSNKDTSITDVIADSSGSLYVVGLTQAGLFGNTLSGTDDAFVAKLNSSGDIVWLNQIGAAGGWTDFNKLHLSSAGNIFVTGSTNRNILGQILVGQHSAVVAKYDSNGNLLWARLLGASGNVVTNGRSITTDSNENVFACGTTAGSLPGNTVAGVRDVYLAKYDISGSLITIKQIGESGSQVYGTACTTDSNNNVYLAGYTYANLDGNFVSGGGAYAYIFKFNNSLIQSWIKQFGALGGDTKGSSVMAQQDGSQVNIYLTGSTSVALGTGVQVGDRDQFLLKLNDQGTQLWTAQVGQATYQTIPADIDQDLLGNVFVAGTTNSNFDGSNGTHINSAYTVSFDALGNLR